MEYFENEKKRSEILEFLEKICYPKDIKYEMNIHNSLTSCQNNTVIILRYHGRRRVIRFDIYRDSISYIKILIMGAIERILDEDEVKSKGFFDSYKYTAAFNDRVALRTAINSIYGAQICSSYLPLFLMPKPKKIILNDPATIIFWSDGTKTVVKKNSKDRKFDPEKGIALCYMKKALGNKGNYNNVFRDWIK